MDRSVDTLVWPHARHPRRITRAAVVTSSRPPRRSSRTLETNTASRYSDRTLDRPRAGRGGSVRATARACRPRVGAGVNSPDGDRTEDRRIPCSFGGDRVPAAWVSWLGTVKSIGPSPFQSARPRGRTAPSHLPSRFARSRRSLAHPSRAYLARATWTVPWRNVNGTAGRLSPIRGGALVRFSGNRRNASTIACLATTFLLVGWLRFASPPLLEKRGRKIRDARSLRSLAPGETPRFARRMRSHSGSLDNRRNASTIACLATTFFFVGWRRFAPPPLLEKRGRKIRDARSLRSLAPGETPRFARRMRSHSGSLDNRRNASTIACLATAPRVVQWWA